MKKTLLFCFSVLLIATQAIGQVTDQSWLNATKQKEVILDVNYYENYPFAYEDEIGNVMGIEVDILKSFVTWCAETKGVEVKLRFKKYDSFAGFYDNTKAMDNGTVGLGSVAITPQRKSEVLFTPPYMKNRSILVSNFEIPTVRMFDDFSTNFEGKTVLVIQGTIHEKELMEIKKLHFPKMRVKYVETPKELLQMVFEDKQYFGYVDLISYWAFVQERCCVLKIHRDVSLEPDYFAFVLPKNSDWRLAFVEFFEGGFGFTATEEYRSILEKYLGYEVIESVELY